MRALAFPGFDARAQRDAVPQAREQLPQRAQALQRPAPTSPAAVTAGCLRPAGAVHPAALNFTAGRNAGLPPAGPPSDGSLSPLRCAGGATGPGSPCPSSRNFGTSWRPLDVRRARHARHFKAFREAVPASEATWETRGEFLVECPSASPREVQTHIVPPSICEMLLPGSRASE